MSGGENTAMMAGPVALLCLDCRQPLVRSEAGGRCPGCGREYPEKDGVVRFLEADDDFYEGVYLGAVNLSLGGRGTLKSRLWFSGYRDPYHRQILRQLRGNDVVLDLACGGGIRWLGEMARVVGLDLSAASVTQARRFYSGGVQADATRMPFPDGSFDVVIHSFVFEHFRPELKAGLLAELRRVLKPGGRLVMRFDCDPQTWFFRWLQASREDYQREFVDHDHHYGLETASVNLTRIEDAGFTIIKRAGGNKTALQNLSIYPRMTPYMKRSRIAALVVPLAKKLNSRRLLWVPYDTFLNWFDPLIEPLLPLDASRLLVVTAQKSGD